MCMRVYVLCMHASILCVTCGYKEYDTGNTTKVEL